MYRCYKQATKVSGMGPCYNIIYLKNDRQNIGAQQSQSRKRPEHGPQLTEKAPLHDPSPSLHSQIASGGSHATDLVTSQRERAHSTFHHVQEVRFPTVNPLFYGSNPTSSFAII